MSRFTIIDAPSILGLKSTGVEDLPKALKKAGLYEKLDAEYAGEVKPSSQYNPKRDYSTLLLKGDAIREFSLELSDAVFSVLDKKQFPIVLGDCSIVIGPLLTLRRYGRYG